MKLDRLAAAWKLYKWENDMAPLTTYEMLQLIEGSNAITAIEARAVWSKMKLISYSLLFFLLLTMQ